MTEQPKHLSMRASDADRERVAKILHDAMGEGRLDLAELDERLQAVYAAKTLGDLVPVTHDLPDVPSPAAPAPRPAAAPRPRQSSFELSGWYGETQSTAPMVAMMGAFEREGDWVVPKFQSAIAIMGGGKLDLREARFAARECTIQIFALMGGVEIIVPEDLTVRMQGVGILGGFNRGESGDGDPDGPVLHITGVAIMGGVDIKRRPLYKRIGKRRRD